MCGMHTPWTHMPRAHMPPSPRHAHPWAHIPQACTPRHARPPLACTPPWACMPPPKAGMPPRHTRPLGRQALPPPQRRILRDVFNDLVLTCKFISIFHHVPKFLSNISAYNDDKTFSIRATLMYLSLKYSI